MNHLNPFKLATLCILVLLLSSTAYCKDQFLIKATNDQDKTVDELSLRLDKKGRPTHLLHIPSGREQLAYTQKQLEKGVVLRRKSGRDLVTLQMQRFSPDEGATVLLTYLYSAVPVESYQSVRLDLAKEKGNWVLKDSKGRRLASLHIRANVASVLGYRQAVGIRQLELRAAE